MLKKLLALSFVSLAVGYSVPVLAQTSAEAQTVSPDSETIVGGRDVFLPSVPVLPIYYTLPMVILMDQDASISSNTPLTDNISETTIWAEAVLECARSYPVMFRETEAGSMPFNIMSRQSDPVVKLNAGGSPVCTNY